MEDRGCEYSGTSGSKPNSLLSLLLISLTTFYFSLPTGLQGLVRAVSVSEVVEIGAEARGKRKGVRKMANVVTPEEENLSYILLKSGTVGKPPRSQGKGL